MLGVHGPMGWDARGQLWVLSFPLLSYCNKEQEESVQVFLKEKRNLPVVSGKADPVKSQMGILEISVFG